MFFRKLNFKRQLSLQGFWDTEGDERKSEGKIEPGGGGVRDGGGQNWDKDCDSVQTAI